MSADAALNLLKKGKQQQGDTLQSLIPLVHTLRLINADLSLVHDLVTICQGHLHHNLSVQVSPTHADTEQVLSSLLRAAAQERSPRPRQPETVPPSYFQKGARRGWD